MTPPLVAPVRPVILVVDDVAAHRELLEGHLADLGYDMREARDGIEALEAVEAQEPDLILLDVEMPGLDGFEVCQRIKSHPRQRLIPVVLLTAHRGRAVRVRGIAAGADDFLTKPFDAEELLLRTKVLLRDRALNKRLVATESVILAFARAVEARYRYTVHHAERVGLYSRELGRAHGAAADDLDLLYEGGVLHDIGKIAIPDAVLLKRGPLTDKEFALIKTHSAEGERICLPLRSTVQFLPIIRHHHERVDGRGYPDHLCGDAVPIGARIAAIGDAWDAMTSDRPYRARLPAEEALRRLRKGAGTQWDAGLADLFIELLAGGLADRVTRAQTDEPVRDLRTELARS